MSQEQTKGARYIQLLDQARCDGDWDAVPELIRKIRKHALERSCLALVAQTEHAVAKAAKGHPSSPVTLDSSGLSSLIAPLSKAIENEQTFVEDKFQAQACLGWIYWTTGEASIAAEKLPTRIRDLDQLGGTGNRLTRWTRVCALKISYIKGTALTRTGAVTEALEAFQSALPVLSSIPPKSISPEERAWTELLLTQFCMLCSHEIKKESALLLETEALAAFRAWASFWEQQSGQVPPPGGIASQSNTPRRQVWREYYIILSSILQNDLPYQATSIASTATSDISARLLQRAELQQVETRYEVLLMQEVRFPRAEQTSGEVEEWVDLVVQNWRILCGSSWQEQELGEGGREAVSRGVLDILYRAATKTFHSTSILRHLFTLHMAVAEFDLAFKAFDTYLEIVKKGKARVEKTGEAENGLDDDGTVLKTASECIIALCRYGSREAAEKANDLGQFLEEWLEKYYQQQPPKTNVNGNDRVIENGGAPRALLISPQTLAIVWRSTGIAQAQWARFTYDTGSRADIQLRAVKSLRRALLPEYEQTDNVNALFALALVLAERRDLSAAIDVVKTALLPPNKPPLGKPNDHRANYSRFSRERSLIPLWHLLALLLSARQEFTTAVRSCEGAFEQFKDPKTLFGDAKLHGGYRSEHLNRVGLQSTNEKFHVSKGIVDDMDDFEKVAVLEVKMTQLALIEVLEGPDVAVNSSDELLSLYTRLFGEPQQPATAAPNTPQVSPPKSSAGTLRSFKGSFFGRSTAPTRKLSGARGRTSTSHSEKILPARPRTSNTSTSATTGAPTIHVTNENGRSPDRAHREKLQKRTPSLARNRSLGSLRNRSPITEQNLQRTLSATTGKSRLDGNLRLQKKTASALNDPEQNGRQRENIRTDLTASQGPSSSRGGRQDLSPKPIPLISQSTSQKVQSPKTNPTISHLPDKLIQPLSTNPVTRFSKSQERRYRISVLVKVWLLIAGFYRRAEMYDDAKGATNEAYKLMCGLEMDVSRDVSGMDNSGWGVFKSVEEQWGDVWSERGHLSNAKSLPYIALSDFEAALVHSSDHPSAIVSLSNILLDIYTEILPPPPTVPSITLQDPFSSPSQSTLVVPTASIVKSVIESTITPVPQLRPLGLPTVKSTVPSPCLTIHTTSTSDLGPSQNDSTTALFDRLAARDRAIGLLSGLTKLGIGWDYSDAWYALARAYEEVGQVDKAKEVLWWCVELEEARAVREWSCVGAGGYVL